MPDEMIKFLTLDRWGTANLDKWWKYMGMKLSLENGDEHLNLTSRRNGDGCRRDDDIDEAIVPVGITNRN